MKALIVTFLIFLVISGCGSSGDKVNVRTIDNPQVPEIPVQRGKGGNNNECLIAKFGCEENCAGESNTSSCKSCCKVTYYHCLDEKGKQNAGGPEYLATHEANCGMQCEKAQEDEWNKAVFKWGAFDQTRNPFANKPPSLSHAENCIATAHAQCVSTQTFPVRSARCCIAQSCELLADEVLTEAMEKCATNPNRGCQDAAEKRSKDVLSQCQSTYHPCRASPISSP